MKLPQHLFALSKTEQRVVILIVVTLLAFAGAKYYRELSISAAPAPTAEPSVPPADQADE